MREILHEVPCLSLALQMEWVHGKDSIVASRSREQVLATSQQENEDLSSVKAT